MKIIVGTFISIVALILAFYNIDFPEILMLLKSANLPLVGFASGVLMGSIGISACRWKIILRHSKSVSLRRLVEGEFIGFFGNNVFPMRMGEMLRSYVLSRQEKIPISEILGSVLTERILDCLIVICFISVLIFAGFFLPEKVMDAFWGLLGILILFPIVILALIRLVKIRFLRNKVARLISSFLSGLQGLRDFRRLPQLGILTLVIWVFYGFTVAFVLGALRIEVGILQVMLVMALTALGIAMPAAPGAMGTYHLAVIIALHNIIGFDIRLSQGAAILLHATTCVPVTILGAYCFFKNNIRLRDLQLHTQSL